MYFPLAQKNVKRSRRTLIDRDGRFSKTRTIQVGELSSYQPIASRQRIEADAIGAVAAGAWHPLDD